MPTGSNYKKVEPMGKYLPYDLPYMTDELRKRARVELFEDEDTRVHSLKLLRKMLDDANMYYHDEDNFLLAFLRARKFDVKRTFNLVKTYYHVRHKRAELYYRYDFEDVRRTLKENSVGFLPYRDEEGCCILIISIERWNPLKNPLGDIMRALTSALFHAVLSPSTQVAGFKVIVDFKGCTFSTLPHISPTYLWLFAEALQNCFPARFKAVHIVNEGVIFSHVWAILRQCLTKKLRDRFHFHGKNMAKLHKYISPDILPSEYEGMLPSFDNTEWAKQVAETAEYLTHVMSDNFPEPKNFKNLKK